MDNFRRRISEDSKPEIVGYVSMFEYGTITADCIDLNAVIPLIHDGAYDYTSTYSTYLYYVPSQSVLIGTVTGMLSTYSYDANGTYIEKVASKNTTHNIYAYVQQYSWGLSGIVVMDFISNSSKRLLFEHAPESTYNGLPLRTTTLWGGSGDWYDSLHTLGTDYKCRLACAEWYNGTEVLNYIYNSTRTQSVWIVVKEDLSEIRFEMGPI